MLQDWLQEVLLMDIRGHTFAADVQVNVPHSSNPKLSKTITFKQNLNIGGQKYSETINPASRH